MSDEEIFQKTRRMVTGAIQVARKKFHFFRNRREDKIIFILGIRKIYIRNQFDVIDDAINKLSKKKNLF